MRSVGDIARGRCVIASSTHPTELYETTDNLDTDYAEDYAADSEEFQGHEPHPRLQREGLAGRREDLRR